MDFETIFEQWLIENGYVTKPQVESIVNSAILNHEHGGEPDETPDKTPAGVEYSLDKTEMDEVASLIYRGQTGLLHIRNKYIHNGRGGMTGINFESGEYGEILIENCIIEDVRNFIMFDWDIKLNGKVTIRNCDMRRCSHSGIRIERIPEKDWINIENCVITNQRSVDGSHASGVSIRRNKVRVKNCVISDGWGTRPIRTYPNVKDDDGYWDIEVIGNDFDDMYNFVEFCDIGGRFKFNNNVVKKEGMPCFITRKAKNCDETEIEIRKNVFNGIIIPMGFWDCMYGNECESMRWEDYMDRDLWLSSGNVEGI